MREEPCRRVIGRRTFSPSPLLLVQPDGGVSLWKRCERMELPTQTDGTPCGRVVRSLESLVSGSGRMSGGHAGARFHVSQPSAEPSLP